MASQADESLEEEVERLREALAAMTAENTRLKEEKIAILAASPSASDKDSAVADAADAIEALKGEKEGLRRENERLRRLSIDSTLAASSSSSSSSSVAALAQHRRSVSDLSAGGLASETFPPTIAESDDEAVAAPSPRPRARAMGGERGDGEEKEQQGEGEPAAEEGTAETSNKALVRFGEDSPFNRAELARSLREAEEMGQTLKRVAKRAQDFCEAGSVFSRRCSELAAEMRRDWSGMPAARPGGGAVTLEEMMGRLGALLAHTGDIMSHLVLNSDTLLVHSLVDFRTRHVRNAAESAKALARSRDDYESALFALLGVEASEEDGAAAAGGGTGGAVGPASGPASSPSEGGGDPSSEGSFFARNRNRKAKAKAAAKARERALTEPELREQVAAARRRYEVARYDHTRLLNNLHTTGVLEVVEVLCASFFGFITFFHEGEYSTTSVRPEIDEANVRIHGQRAANAAAARSADDDRASLERGLDADGAAYSVADAFPAPGAAASGASTSSVMLRGRHMPVARQGYLRKQSSSIKKDWKRRWFVLQDGQLFYYRSADNLEPHHVVNVIICSVRESREAGLRHCFELISPNKRTYLLQAESADDMAGWIGVFRNCTESMLAGGGGSAKNLMTGGAGGGGGGGGGAGGDDASDSGDRAGLAEVRRRNSACCDCGEPSPEWASISLGCLICIACSGIHRSLGTHISKVRSVTLDEWDEAQVRVFLDLGNERVNELYEHRPHPEFPKPAPGAPRAEKAAYIQSKYVAKLFMNKSAVDTSMSEEETNRALYEAAAAHDTVRAWTLTAFGANPNWHNAQAGGATPLHAATGDTPEAKAAFSFLVQAGARIDELDDDGRAPGDPPRQKEVPLPPPSRPAPPPPPPPRG